jgi:hypothetical protein
MYYNRQHTPKPKHAAAYARRSSELEVVMNYLDGAKGGKKP